MSKIRENIEECNSQNTKSLTAFITSGYPNPENFADLVVQIANSGADIIEIGLPFGDSLADGPVVQSSYLKSLEKGINLDKTFRYIAEIKSKIKTPIILMSSSNPIVNFGIENFCSSAKDSGIDGVIIPDVPLEEYDGFFINEFDGLDTILLTTPTSPENRIKEIDKRSSGFVYCVSVVGTTGIRNKFDDYVFENLSRTYKTVEQNKMQIGFGISSPENVKQFSNYCDGVIVGSAIIKSLEKDDIEYSNTLNLIRQLKAACKN